MRRPTLVDALNGVIALAVVFLIYMVVGQYKERKRCEERGGVPVSDRYDTVCLSKEVIK